MILKILTFLFVFCVSSFARAQLPHFVPVETPEPGIGSWQEMPFGQMRLLSCTTGVKDLPMVVGGLQVQLHPDWIMKKPTLMPLSDKYPSWIEAPVAAGDGVDPQYKGEVLFPLVYNRSYDDKADFELGVQGNLPVCQGQKCMTLPIRIGLTLKGDVADYTAACPYLIDQQSQAPQPAEAKGVKGFAWRQGNEIQMAFMGIQNTSIAFLQTTTKIPFQLHETQLEKDGLLMRVETQPWSLKTSQDWVLITDRGVFKVPVQMVSDAIPFPPTPTPKTTWFLGWELFFLTPLFIWWGLGCAQTNKKWKKEILSLMLFLPLVLVIKVLLNSFYPLDLLWYGVILLGIVCLFPPVQKRTTLGLFMLWPYFPEIPQMEMSEIILWLVIMVLEVELPFLVLYLKVNEIGPVLRDLKKKHFFVCNLIFLLPTVFLLSVFIGHVFRGKAVFFNELNPNGLSVVCPTKEQNSWKNNAHLIDQESALGKTLQNIYKRKRVVVFQDENGRLVLAPDTSPKKALGVISNWKNYHAASKP